MPDPSLPFESSGGNKISLSETKAFMDSDKDTSSVDIQAGENEIQRLARQYDTILEESISATSDCANVDLEQGLAFQDKHTLSQEALEEARRSRRLIGYNDKHIRR